MNLAQILVAEGDRMQARLVLENTDSLGESPLWCASTESLFWLDLLKPRLHRYSYSGGRHEVRPLPLKTPLGMIALTTAPDVLLLTQPNGVSLYNWRTDSISFLCHPEASRSDIAYNDGKVDPQGRLWLGSLDLAERDPRGALWMLEVGEAPVLVDAGFNVVNGPAFSVDGKIAYVSDSVGKLILAYDVAEKAPWLRARRVFAKMQDDEGFPDGLTVDADNHLWCAHWDGSRVTRFSPDGTRVDVISLLPSRVTSVAFGGPSLEDLFITTASCDLSDVEITRTGAGGVFSLKPGVRGLNPTPFEVGSAAMS